MRVITDEVKKNIYKKNIKKEEEERKHVGGRKISKKKKCSIDIAHAKFLVA